MPAPSNPLRGAAGPMKGLRTKKSFRALRQTVAENCGLSEGVPWVDQQRVREYVESARDCVEMLEEKLKSAKAKKRSPG